MTMRHTPLYLDYAATTPVDPRVAARMIPYLTEQFGNPASRSHAFGWTAEQAVEAARNEVASLIGADPRSIVWTSGATESNNLALKGAAQFNAARGPHVVTVRTEHKSVLDTVRDLERQGFAATVLDVGSDGLLDADAFAAALTPETTVASVMLVNNEIGVVQDIATLGRSCRERGVLFHVDAAQAAGKLPIDLAALPVDLMSLSAHKVYGPKGIGALYVGRKPRSLSDLVSRETKSDRLLGCASRRRCTAAATSGERAPARCRLTGSWAWAKPIASRGWRWTPSSKASP
jgi:cysteine desulfurase